MIEYIKNLFKAKTVPVKNPRPSLMKRIIEPDKFEKVEIISLAKKTAGRHHAWYNTNVGLIRKPIQ